MTMSHWFKAIFIFSIFIFTMKALEADAEQQRPQGVDFRAQMLTAVQSQPALSAKDIIALAHSAAGGEQWRKPGRLKLTGYNLIRRDGQEVIWDRYTMWREFSTQKTDAHTADGKVRIEAWSGDNLALLLAFDGHKTYDQNGEMTDQSANTMWSSNFGYGAIRNALDEGWKQKRLPDDMVDGQASFMIELNDPAGGATWFGIRQSDFAVVYVGFNTPRGWHERRYSHFFSKPDISWKQPGRVRLFYDGVKSNEAIWTDFDLSGDWPEGLFAVRAK